MVKVMGMRESWILNSSQRLISNLKVDPTLPSPCSESHLSFRGGCSLPDEEILPTVSEDCFTPVGFAMTKWPLFLHGTLRAGYTLGRPART
jgi:hypothetical protein